MTNIYIRNDRRESETSVELLKVDACDRSIHLEGAVFDLFKRDDTSSRYFLYRCQLVTDEHGLLQVNDLEPGKYRFVETQAPDGYVLNRRQGCEFIISPRNDGYQCGPEKLIVCNRRMNSCGIRSYRYSSNCRQR